MWGVGPELARCVHKIVNLQFLSKKKVPGVGIALRASLGLKIRAPAAKHFEPGQAQSRFDLNAPFPKQGH